MSAIYLLIPLSLCVALAFLAFFIWAVGSGQYEDTSTPAMRILADDDFPTPQESGSEGEERKRERT